jgi:hypothetical protein
MGCDIHVFLERRLNKGPWKLDPKHHEEETYAGGPVRYNEVASLSGRNYELFGLIAGVRSMEEPLYDPRGIPDDACDEVKAMSTEDYHTHTWLRPQELKRIFKKWEKNVVEEDSDFKFNWNTSAADAFNDKNYGFNDGVLNYIDQELAMQEAENHLLGGKYKLEFRLVIWFDS